MKVNTYRAGKVHVNLRRCKTCIFRPGNLMHLEPGRVESMCDEADVAGSAITCHSTLGTDNNAVCRGYWDRKSSTTLIKAEKAGVIEWSSDVEGETYEKARNRKQLEGVA